MKRILVLMLCVVLLCVLPISIFATGSAATIPIYVAAIEGADAPDAEKSEEQVEVELMTDKIVSYVQSHFEELTVLVGLLVSAFYRAKKDSASGKVMGTLNNNAVAVAENSKAAIDHALEKIGAASGIVENYVEQMKNLLEEVRTNEEDKQKMKAALDTAMKYVETAKASNLEFANEFAELLVLANIPNSKKEELYARHRAAVASIASIETEAKPDETTEE
ncbi:MAG: hypothetical protein J6D16_05685 [Clostridia bacterium]|nr:hypothetical protein [Clostridia bacterium]